MSNFLYKKILLQENKVSFKKLYVVDIVDHKKTNNIRYIDTINYSQFISDHYYASLKYTLAIDKKTNENIACKQISIQKVDLSIIVESGSITENEKELVSSCISELFLFKVSTNLSHCLSCVLI